MTERVLGVLFLLRLSLNATMLGLSGFMTVRRQSRTPRRTDNAPGWPEMTWIKALVALSMFLVGALDPSSGSPTCFERQRQL